MVEEQILVFYYFHNNTISCEQEYSGQNSTCIIRIRDLTTLQDSCKEKSSKGGILYFLSAEEAK
jgi:hypothetical protein